MKSAIVFVVFAVFSLDAGSQVFAQSKSDSTAKPTPIHIVREGAENPFKEVAKSTTAGFGAGLALAIAASLVADNTEDIGKGLIVGGTVVGLIAGIHHVAKRPKTTAALPPGDASALVKVSVPQTHAHCDDGCSEAKSASSISVAF